MAEPSNIVSTEGVPTPESVKGVEIEATASVPSIETPVSSVTPQEIAAVEKELNEPIIDYGQFSKVLAEAIKPLIPQSPKEVKIWETDDFVKDRPTLVNGIVELFKHKQEEYHKNTVEPLIAELQRLRGIVPELYTRAAENPLYGQLNTRAIEIEKTYGIERWTALRMAEDELKRTSNATTIKPPVPKHMSSPDTSVKNVGEVPESGPANFADIMRAIRASGKEI